MRVLIIHQEAEYFAGAEVLLGYFLDQILSSDCQVTVAMVQQSKAARVLPGRMRAAWLQPNSRFSLGQFARQVRQCCHTVRANDIDVIHGWAARDWELAAATAKVAGRPVLGTLHDHPCASFISPKRQKLMRGCANWGLDKTVCISEAVRSACVAAGYRQPKLEVAHNGLPFPDLPRAQHKEREAVKIAFLGAISERKGLRGLFTTLERLAVQCQSPWEVFIAGAALEASGAELQRGLQARYASESWSSKVHWCGWVEKPLEFLAGMDLMICPSSEFEPFGLVICEAAGLGVPVLASRTGGPEEILVDGESGWLFDAGDWAGAARRLAEAVSDRTLREGIGIRGREHVRKKFSIEKMVAEYLRVYSTLLGT